MRNLTQTLVLLALLVGACSPAGAAKKLHNVVLIIADDQGLDLGAYGNKKIKSPNLDKLASEGTLFTNGFSTVSSCSPSRSVIFTGLYSHSNGMYGLAHDVHNQHLLPWVKTLPALLKQSGYSTCLVGKKHILPSESLPFDEELVPEHPSKRDVVLMADEAGTYISKHKNDPFFLVFAFSDPHRAEKGFGVNAESDKSQVEYNPEELDVPSHLPDLPAVREDLAQYCEAISRLDRGVGLLLEKLKESGESESTLVIYLSDNGRPFPGAKTNLYDDGIHLPLIVVSPEQKRHGVRNDAMVSWVDIAPTILDWAGAAAPPYKLPGKSLLSILDQEHSDSREHVFASHNFHEIQQFYPMRAVRNRQYKYISNLAFQLPYPLSTDIAQSASWAAIKAKKGSRLGQRSLSAFFQRPAEELYDLSKDPMEVHNLAGDASFASVMNEMGKKLKDFQAETQDPWCPELARAHSH